MQVHEASSRGILPNILRGHGHRRIRPRIVRPMPLTRSPTPRARWLRPLVYATTLLVAFGLLQWNASRERSRVSALGEATIAALRANLSTAHNALPAAFANADPIVAGPAAQSLRSLSTGDATLGTTPMTLLWPTESAPPCEAPALAAFGIDIHATTAGEASSLVLWFAARDQSATLVGYCLKSSR